MDHKSGMHSAQQSYDERSQDLEPDDVSRILLVAQATCIRMGDVQRYARHASLCFGSEEGDHWLTKARDLMRSAAEELEAEAMPE